jgi:transcriptional regulator GlxA family with amidase domain
MKVAIVIFDGVQALDVAGPLDVFAEANTMLSAPQKYEVSLVGPRSVYIQREGGQSQYSPYSGSGRDEDPVIGKVHRYVTEHITEALSIEQLAGAVAVSRRTFSRVFAKYAKVTPSVFVEQVRVDTARKLLEDTDAPLKTVAFKCGFRSATHMRTTFSRRLEVTPKQYRQRFRGEAGNAPWAHSGAGKQASFQGLSPQ